MRAYKWSPGQPTLKSRVADIVRPEVGGTVIEDGPQVVSVRWDAHHSHGTPREQFCPISWLQPHSEG